MKLIVRIDLTRMECKYFIIVDEFCSQSSIDLTRMECKYVKNVDKIQYLVYRFNQNGM